MCKRLFNSTLLNLAGEFQSLMAAYQSSLEGWRAQSPHYKETHPAPNRPSEGEWWLDQGVGPIHEENWEASYEAYPNDFEAEVNLEGQFIGPDGQLWAVNVFGFGRAPNVVHIQESRDIEDYPGLRVWVRDEMFCGRI